MKLSLFNFIKNEFLILIITICFALLPMGKHNCIDHHTRIQMNRMAHIKRRKYRSDSTHIHPLNSKIKLI